eukprot:g7235.t1
MADVRQNQKDSSQLGAPDGHMQQRPRENAPCSTTCISNSGAAPASSKLNGVVAGFTRHQISKLRTDSLLQLLKVFVRQVQQHEDESLQVRPADRNPPVLRRVAEQLKLRFDKKAISGRQAVDILSLMGAELRFTDDFLLPEVWLAVRSAVGEYANACFGLAEPELPPAPFGHEDFVKALAIKEYDAKLKNEDLDRWKAVGRLDSTSAAPARQAESQSRPTTGEFFLLLHKILTAAAGFQSSTGCRALGEIAEILENHPELLHRRTCSFAEKLDCLRGFAIANAELPNALVRRLTSGVPRDQQAHQVGVASFCELASVYCQGAAIAPTAISHFRSTLEALFSPNMMCANDVEQAEAGGVLQGNDQQEHCVEEMELADLANCLQFYAIAAVGRARHSLNLGNLELLQPGEEVVDENGRKQPNRQMRPC